MHGISACYHSVVVCSVPMVLRFLIVRPLCGGGEMGFAFLVFCRFLVF